MPTVAKIQITIRVPLVRLCVKGRSQSRFFKKPVTLVRNAIREFHLEEIVLIDVLMELASIYQYTPLVAFSRLLTLARMHS